MNHSSNPVLESSNPSWIVNSSPKLSSESETLSTETSGAGYPPKPPKSSMIEEFGFNNQLFIVDSRRRKVQQMLNQFLGFFGAETISRMLDFALLVEALAMLVGVSPHTVEMVIRDWLEKQ
ncbi:MAG: hypothetical protein RID09_06520 [Coleofasciculus sp. G1-WW12-02]|uniref:hypothetical protein n=1 Tax=Coleofasciculus sp. G1-WW12-02 TaxID=3068483 RepID=UPI0032F5A8E7